MGFSLAKVFHGSHKTQLHVSDSMHVSIELSHEAFYRYLFAKDKQELSIPQKLVVDVCLQNMQKKEVRNKAVPRLPNVIPRLLKSLRDPDSSARDYVDIIDKDPVMASSVLKLANSAYFNPIGRRINEIEQAVVKLGISGLRSVLSAAVMQPILQKESAYFSQSGQRIWQHSLTCAVACERIAIHRKLDPYKVYLLGLVHDIGKITLFSELSKQFKLNKEEVGPGYNAFVPPLRKMSAALSYWIAKDWELDEALIHALADQCKIKKDEEVSAFGHTLYQADLASELYVCVYPKKPKKAQAVLHELDLPMDLFEHFEKLNKQL
ncbi:HDOD domain-containing protein [Agaribacterium sp. ZY112]|uniref:HDOD domain-containing protein n=1 Tax=Agaribacterium sp. ZY112 TaxID=3233574 RepID=UPI003523D0CF